MIELLCPCGFKSRHASSESGRLVRCRRCRTRQRVPDELDPADLLRALEAKKAERTHHYVFAHRVLPEVSLSDPQQVYAVLTGPRGADFLADLWAEVGAACPVHLSDDGLTLSLEAVEGLDDPVALVHLPDPVIPPEAHFLAVVPWRERRLFGLVQKQTVRCFTLEQGIRLTGGLRTVVCEWTRDDEGELEHKNYGDGPPANETAFLRRLAGVLQG